MPKWFNAAWATAGVAAVIGASDLLVESAKHIGTGLSLQDSFMGAVGVGLGMTMPELVLGFTAALKKRGEFALGNTIGCNIFTTLGVGGAVALAAMGVPEAMKVATPAEILNLAAFAGSAGLATTALMANQGSLKKWHGWAGIGLYAAYAAGAWALGHQTPAVQPPQATPAPIIQQQQGPAPLEAPAARKVVLNEMPKYFQDSADVESAEPAGNASAPPEAPATFKPSAQDLKPAPFALF